VVADPNSLLCSWNHVNLVKLLPTNLLISAALDRLGYREWNERSYSENAGLVRVEVMEKSR